MSPFSGPPIDSRSNRGGRSGGLANLQTWCIQLTVAMGSTALLVTVRVRVMNDCLFTNEYTQPIRGCTVRRARMAVRVSAVFAPPTQLPNVQDTIRWRSAYMSIRAVTSIATSLVPRPRAGWYSLFLCCTVVRPSRPKWTLKRS
jgi:hypothetical protein